MIVIALLVAAAVPPTDNFGKPFQPWVPADVRTFVIRAQACIHFSGEPSGEGERKAFLERMTRETCTGLDDQERRLKHKYRGSVRTKRLIAETWDQ